MARKRNSFAPSEDQITAAVVDHWRLLGRLDTLVASIPNKKAFGQPGLTRGLPDLLVLAPGLPVGFIELKKDLRSHYSDDQRLFKRLCEALGIPYPGWLERNFRLDHPSLGDRITFANEYHPWDEGKPSVYGDWIKPAK